MTCPHGMPTPASCVECMEDGPVAAPLGWERVGTPFAAGYFGRCPSCDGVIEQGELIQRWDRGADRTDYLHTECRPC